MCVDAGIICLKGLESDRNWRRRSNSYKSVTYTSHSVNDQMGKVMHVLFLHNHYWWNRVGNVNITYVVSVLHIGVHYIHFLMQKGQCLAVS